MSEPRNLRTARAEPAAFEDTLERLAASGPDWLRGLRREAWSRARQLGLPERDSEAWRYSALELLDAEAYQPPARPAALALPSPEVLLGLPGLDGAHEGRAVEPGRTWLSAEARRAGVILTDLREAADLHPELVKERLGRLVPPGDGLLARNLALHEGGAFLRVPRGVELRAPIALVSGLAGGEARHTRHLLVVEPGAKVVICEVAVSAPVAPAGLLDEVVELQIGEGAWVGWLRWQELGRNGARLASTGAASLSRDAHLESLAVSLGGEYSRAVLQVALAGSGARSDLLGIAFPTGRQRVEHWTLQDHRAPSTTSDLLYRGALADQAQSLYYGTIRVRPGASRTDAYQQSRNLLLSSGARADTNPQLEIANNDVRCTHGATVGPIDEEQLFYLMSRGLPRAQAERLLVFGFFADVLARSTWSGVGPAVERAVGQRAGQPEPLPGEREARP